MRLEYIKNKIRTISDFPKKGIQFKDITTLLSDPSGLRYTIDLFAERYQGSALTKIVGIEARGFIFGSALADRLQVGFVPIRKKGKLPYKTVSISYALEYGTDTMEMHEDALLETDKVIVIDDLLATGGTALAAMELVEKFNCNIQELAFVINLSSLPGEARLRAANKKIYSMLSY
jgi:adenine phosphoribosyltransferase